MFKQLLDIIKWFTDLNNEKRIISFMITAILFLGFFFIKKDAQNQKQHIELKLEYRKRLDTCENKSIVKDEEISYWKDSLASEKLHNALNEIENYKHMAESMKKSEKNIISNSKNIKIKQHQILNKLKDEK